MIMKVLKFGGTSVGSVENMSNVKSIINDGKKKVVVLSAMSGTTNQLVAIAQDISDSKPNEAIEKINNAKAKLIYDEIDSNPNFIGYAAQEDRSFMNVTFNLADDAKKDQFDALWKAAGIEGLKGHRSVGGYRASIYNALPLESVQVLVDVMKQL